jgi:ornithine carbamoyltransferase
MHKDLITLDAWGPDDVRAVLDLGHKVKAQPEAFRDRMAFKTLLMLFEKPSLRTRVSFETGMTQLGGHAIYYNISTSPLGKKESIEDFARVITRMCDAIMARTFSHRSVEVLSELCTIPVVNGLTDFSHPCQILADLLTVEESKGELAGRTLTYMGDSNNNVTHSLIYGCALAGMNIRIGCPAGEAWEPQPQVLARGREIARGTEILVTHDAAEAARDADVVYTDSWMSYHIDPAEREARLRDLMPYQVNAELMAHARPDVIFMNCLPAMRGDEQTAEVIDGPRSVVFQEAENRLHAQKALLLLLMGGA